MPSPLKEILDFDFLGLVAAIALNMLELVGSPAADLTIFFFPLPFSVSLAINGVASLSASLLYYVFNIYFIMRGFRFYNRPERTPVFFFLASYFIPSGAVVK